MNWAVVMCGGKGTRFWPESRAKRPKPFLRLLGQQTLLEETVHRLSPFIPPSRIVIVLQDFLLKEARRLLPRIPKENFLGEPVGKNTAPCCVWAAAHVSRRDPHARLVFLPADQHIPEKALFQKTLKTAFQIVDERPVLLAIRPDSPQTGFGYLQTDRKQRKVKGIPYRVVKRFWEKPNLKRAKAFLRRGNFYWNGGTFVWRLEAFRRAIRNYAPRLYPAFKRFASVRAGLKPASSIEKIYARLPSISIDYAVMEKMKNLHCLIAPFQCHDVGSWPALAQFWSRDQMANRVSRMRTTRRPPAGEAGVASTVLIRSKGNIVKSRRLVALLGVRDLVVIDTEDALLICPRSEAEGVREIVKELEERKAHRYL